MGRRDSSKSSRRCLNVDGKGLSVADMATYKPNLDNKDFAAHMHVTLQSIKEASEDKSDKWYPKKKGR